MLFHQSHAAKEEKRDVEAGSLAVINCVLIEADIQFGELFIYKFVLRCVFDRIVMDDAVRER